MPGTFSPIHHFGWMVLTQRINSRTKIIPFAGSRSAFALEKFGHGGLPITISIFPFHLAGSSVVKSAQINSALGWLCSKVSWTRFSLSIPATNSDPASRNPLENPPQPQKRSKTFNYPAPRMRGYSCLNQFSVLILDSKTILISFHFSKRRCSRQ